MNLAIVLDGNMIRHNWTINGEPYSETNPLKGTTGPMSHVKVR